MTYKAELILDVKTALGESPMWNPHDDCLYFVDITSGELHRYNPSGGGHHVWRRETMLGCIAVGNDGSLVAGSHEGFVRLIVDKGRLVETPLKIFGAEFDCMRMNDGTCDRQGRFWAGSMNYAPNPSQPDGALYRLDADGSHAKINADLLVANGMAFSPDGKRFYMSDTHPTSSSIWTYDYDIDNGMPSNRQLFADTKQQLGRPDGAAMDVDGCYWSAANDAGLIHRYTPTGEIDISIKVPTAKPTKICFGGRDYKTMYITSIRLDDENAGGLFALELPYQGIVETEFNFTK